MELSQRDSPADPTKTAERKERSAVESLANRTHTVEVHEASPFRVVDPGFKVILLCACAGLADLARTLGAEDIAAGHRCFVAGGLAALESL